MTKGSIVFTKMYRWVGGGGVLMDCFGQRICPSYCKKNVCICTVNNCDHLSADTTYKVHNTVLKVLKKTLITCSRDQLGA